MVCDGGKDRLLGIQGRAQLQLALASLWVVSTEFVNHFTALGKPMLMAAVDKVCVGRANLVKQLSKHPLQPGATQVCCLRTPLCPTSFATYHPATDAGILVHLSLCVLLLLCYANR